MSRRRLPRVATATITAGVVLAGSTVVAAVVAGPGERGERGSPGDRGGAAAPAVGDPADPALDEAALAPLDEAAARDLLVAWRRNLEATYVAEGRFERVTRQGRPLTGETYVAQRPPDRVEAAFGSLDATLGGNAMACGEDDEGVTRCRSLPEGRSLADDVEGEMARLEGLLVDDPSADIVAPYVVEALGGGCFELTLRFVLPAPPYGEAARFCFDAGTGARVLSEVRHSDDVVDRHDVVRLSATVTDEDLVRPAPARLRPLLDG